MSDQQPPPADGRHDAVDPAPPAVPAPAPITPTSAWGEATGARPGYGPQDDVAPSAQQPAPYGQQTTTGSSSGAPQYGAPQYGAPQYGAPQYGAPQYGAPQYGAPQNGPQQYGQQPPPQYPQQYQPQYGQAGLPAAPAGYRPPSARQGIIPLRPLGLGDIFDGAFRSIRANPRVMFGFTAIVIAVAVTIQALIQWALTSSFAGALTDLTGTFDPTGELGLGDTLGSTIAQIATLPLLLMAITVLTGVLIVSVSRSVIGETITIAELWSQNWRRVLVLVVFSAATNALVLLGWGLIVGAVVLLVTLDLAPLAVAVGLVGLVAGVAGTWWFQIRILLVPASLVLEGTTVREAIGRGWRLTRGSFWRLLGIYILTSLIVGFVAQVIVTPAAMISAVLFADPTLTTGGPLIVVSVGTALGYTVTTVFTAAVVALLYIDLRIRKEGLDVELARAAEAAAARG